LNSSECYGAVARQPVPTGQAKSESFSASETKAPFTPVSAFSPRPVIRDPRDPPGCPAETSLKHGVRRVEEGSNLFPAGPPNPRKGASAFS
jgi:hypothetical protein